MDELVLRYAAKQPPWSELWKLVCYQLHHDIQTYLEFIDIARG